MRENNLTTIVDALKANVDKCRENGEQPDSILIYKDFEDIGVPVEYECFTSNKSLILYRRSVVKMVALIKKLTEENIIFPETKTHVPKERRLIGGGVKDLENKLKEVDKEVKAKKPIRVPNSFKKDLKIQTKIFKFFGKTSSDEESEACPVKEEDDDDDGIADEEMEKEKEEEKPKATFMKASELLKMQKSEGRTLENSSDVVEEDDDVKKEEVNPVIPVPFWLQKGYKMEKLLKESVEVVEDKPDNKRKHEHDGSHSSKKLKSSSSSHKSSKRKGDSEKACTSGSHEGDSKHRSRAEKGSSSRHEDDSKHRSHCEKDSSSRHEDSKRKSHTEKDSLTRSHEDDSKDRSHTEKGSLSRTNGSSSKNISKDSSSKGHERDSKLSIKDSSSKCHETNATVETLLPEKDQRIPAKSPPKPIKERKSEQVHQTQQSPTEALKTKELIIFKAKMADYVMKELMPFYKKRRFESKDLFKTMAKRISHLMYDKVLGKF